MNETINLDFKPTAEQKEDFIERLAEFEVLRRQAIKQVVIEFCERHDLEPTPENQQHVRNKYRTIRPRRIKSGEYEIPKRWKTFYESCRLVTSLLSEHGTAADILETQANIAQDLIPLIARYIKKSDATSEQSDATHSEDVRNYVDAFTKLLKAHLENIERVTIHKSQHRANLGTGEPGDATAGEPASLGRTIAKFIAGGRETTRE